ncbi:MAG: class I SAM-dependent methyltransferase [Gammaproteobacteria bacterium]|nr:class I SAM-dependent methyltransferase [Gammaproteobacteria bacterium]MBU1603007.1 class I SAM-dependent methyltransferase [Gammaproteobacteria bacterium]MBU2434099.1 class I SAM-dependent methyltransferase [Gammaproteobacteria bacterium]MBU2448548.1 class I SAM-dependent methyltransferase [Gammaproteobacteria bacterium]
MSGFPRPEDGLSSVANVRIEALAPAFADRVAALAGVLGWSLAGEAEFALQLGAAGLQLQELGADASGPVRVDFLEGAVAHRRQHGGGSGQMIAKAVGIQPGVRPTILDATAGLGRDAFLFAQLGCQVTLIERHPLVGALLADGMARALNDPEVGPIIERMQLRQGDAIELMRAWSEEAPQVIYLDPMFPHRDKSSLVKKEMRVFRPLVGGDDDASQLLAAALNLATHRVVVKRPRKAPSVDGQPPGYVLEGKSSRYDVYPRKALKARP